MKHCEENVQILPKHLNRAFGSRAPTERAFLMEVLYAAQIAPMMEEEILNRMSIVADSHLQLSQQWFQMSTPIPQDN